MKKDSLGNPLPADVFLPLNSTPDQISQALSVNTFNLAVSVAIENGKTVIYDAEAKQATISDANGMTSFISHG